MDNFLIQKDNIDLKQKIQSSVIDKINIDSQLKKIIEDINNFDGNKYKNSIENIKLEAILFSEWAKLANVSKDYKHNGSGNISKELEKKLIQLQTNEFPIMRKAYGEIIISSIEKQKDNVWSENIKINIYGLENSIIELVDKKFIDTKNITKIQKQIYDMAKLLRFSNINYRASQYADEYISYNIKSDADNKLIEIIEIIDN